MTRKDQIKTLITFYQTFVTGVSYQQRLYTFEDNANYVFVGLRRAGKSYLMYQRIGELLRDGHSPEEILFFNFEDDRLGLMQADELDLIIQCYNELYSSKPILFLDEIQIVVGWEKFARRLADTGYRVYITGSNAKMLSNEIATTLGGRFMVKKVYPYSFSEYASAMGVGISSEVALYKNKTEIARLFSSYLSFGGLPETLAINDKRSWLSGLYSKIYLGDMVARHQIRNAEALRLLIRKIAESVMQPMSYNRMAQVVLSVGGKVSVATVMDYVGYMLESWLIVSVENITGKFREKESVRKYYFVDNGILNLFLLDPEAALLENIVALSLSKVYGEDVYFYRENVEVDFVVPTVKRAIQVCYSLSDEETKRREVQSLVKFSKLFPDYTCEIVTREEEDTIAINGMTIAITPASKWVIAMERRQETNQ